MLNEEKNDLIKHIALYDDDYSRKDCIYLDYHASTPLDPRVLHKMIISLTENYGNPHSTTHAIGRAAEDEIQISREKIAKSFNIFPEEIIFTSGATEANNLALLGLTSGLSNTISKIITIATEHKSVIEPISHLQSNGFKTEILPVLEDGSINLDLLEQSLKSSETALISISAANGEIGTIHPLQKISNLCNQYRAYWHCDGTQAVGRIPLDITNLSIDLFTFSGHKIYGPKGIGALIINPNLKSIINPIMHGGGQQSGLRAGTLPTFLCTALAEATILATTQIEKENVRVLELRNQLLDYIIEKLSGILNGSHLNRLSNNINVSFPGIKALDIIANTPELSISTGSACSSSGGRILTSHVLRAITQDENIISGSIRLGLGRFSTEEDIKKAIYYLDNTIRKLRQHAK